MINFICHPVLTTLLTPSKMEMNCVQSPIEGVLISDFYPQGSNEVHGSLLEAVKYRLTNPSGYIFFTSSFPRNEMLMHDNFGNLTLL